MRKSAALVTAEARERRPGVPDRLFRRRADQFWLYLAGISFWSGRYFHAASLALRAWRSGLLFRVLPYAAKLLWKRWTFAGPPAVQRMVPGRSIDSSLVAPPLISYDRIYHDIAVPKHPGSGKRAAPASHTPALRGTACKS